MRAPSKRTIAEVVTVEIATYASLLDLECTSVHVVWAHMVTAGLTGHNVVPVRQTATHALERQTLIHPVASVLLDLLLVAVRTVCVSPVQLVRL